DATAVDEKIPPGSSGRDFFTIQISYRRGNSPPSAAGQDGAGRAVRDAIGHAVDCEMLGQPRACAVHAALDGPDRAAADFGRLLVGEPRCADQDQRLALVGGQLGERSAELLEFNAPVLLRMRFETFGMP